MLGNPNTSQGERSLEDRKKKAEEEVEAQVSPGGEWQAQGFGGSAGGLEAGVGGPRGAHTSQLSEMTLLISGRG